MSLKVGGKTVSIKEIILSHLMEVVMKQMQFQDLVYLKEYQRKLLSIKMMEKIRVVIQSAQFSE